MKTKARHILTSIILLASTTPVISQDTLMTQQFEMNNCIQIYHIEGKRIVRTKSDLDSLVRQDMSKNKCNKQLQQIDLVHYSILGINLNSGWCKTPLGLEFITTKNDMDKKYTLTVSYQAPIGTCRARSSYNLWVKVPAIPNGYKVEFIVNPKEPTQ